MAQLTASSVLKSSGERTGSCLYGTQGSESVDGVDRGWVTSPFPPTVVPALTVNAMSSGKANDGLVDALASAVCCLADVASKLWSTTHMDNNM